MVLLALTVALSASTYAAVTLKGDDNESEWSEESNGLEARLALCRWKVTNGSCIIATYLELKNVGDTANPLLLTVTPDNMSFRVTDKNGKEVAVNTIRSFNGKLFGTPGLVVPFDSSMRVRIGPTGHGIPVDVAAHLDLGIKFCWGLPQDEYYLSAVLDIEKSTKLSDAGNPWHGRIELPRVLIPTKPSLIAPEKLDALIQELGTKMLSKNSRESEEAFRQMSLTDDPRVVAWYVKAVATDRYGSKCEALDRLGYFDGDEAFEGLKLGVATKVEDIGNATNREVAESLVNNIRHYAVRGLARSPHPQAAAFLLSLHDDSSKTIRLAVVQAAAKMATTESLALVQLHIDDEDPIVREEADRLFNLHKERSDE